MACIIVPARAVSNEPAGRPRPRGEESVHIREFQRLIERIYYDRDAARGVEGSFRWFVEEVGELARALRQRDPARLREEFSDALAWLATLASISGVELEAAVDRYAHGCPKCGRAPCECEGD